MEDGIWINPRHHHTVWGHFRIYVKTALAETPFESIDMAHHDGMRRK